MSDETMATQDPANYRAMNEPHASTDAANDAWRAFLDDVKSSRAKHRIANVLVVAEMAVIFPSGESRALSLAHYGDELKSESMAAYAYGIQAKNRQDMIAEFIAGKAQRR